MSEELNLEANNLCIAEDAFEKFQAVSMYQEKEYIVLPQNVPPNPKPPEPGKNNPTSSVTEVVLSSDVVTTSPVISTQIDDCFEEQPRISSQVESSVIVENEPSITTSAAQIGQSSENSDNVINNYVNNSDMIVSNSENVNNQGNTTLESPPLVSNVVPRRRGRKQNIQNPHISSTPFSSEPETSDTVTVVRRKRGRPPKVRPEILGTLGPNNNDQNKDLSSELSSSDNNRSDEVSVQRTRRGRLVKSTKKISMELNLAVQKQLVAIKNACKKEEEVQNEQLSSSNETSKRIKRRKRVSSVAKSEENPDDYKLEPDSNNEILCDSISENDDQDDICLSKLKSVPTQSDSSKSAEESSTANNKTDGDLKDVSSVNVDEQIKKVKRKRGRPKKANIESLSQMIENMDPSLKTSAVKEVTEILDDADDMCLSKLRTVTDNSSTNLLQEITFETDRTDKDNSVTEVEIELNTSDMNETPSKRNTKVPVMADFEYNIDSVIENDTTDMNNQYGDNSLLVEDTSRRPNRRKSKKLHYDEESDEDPFANVELSDDEPRRGRRGNKYYSDYEYIPGKRGNAAMDSTDTEISENDNLIKLDETKRQRRKKPRKKSDNQSPRKKGKNNEDPTQANVEQKELIDQVNDIEITSETSATKASDSESQPPQAWGASTEFENFLAKKIQGTSLKIKKVSSNVPNEKNKMDIPVVNQDAKKTIEMCSQTICTPTTSVAVQTSTPYDIPLKENLPLTTEQSEKACYFLNGIVKTTAELGLLMTQKSEDFIKKKINTSHVTDTVKMDYCVKKSFLLFKLAKHNLQQMEEDLAKQYDDFLKSNNLTKCREEQKQVLPTSKDTNSDSDCEIVEVQSTSQVQPKTSQKSQAKPAFNPKTVFLNKELSIKIAKKPNENKKLDIKGRHTVWINDTVMVKKVKPTQSFLAQDSRNKKPPDNRITTEMVSDFFKDYYRQRALAACAPFISKNWLNVNKECVCNYFVVKPLQFNAEANYSDADEFSINSNTSNTTVTEARPSLSDVKTLSDKSVASSPERLFTLCFRILKIQLYHESFQEVSHKKGNDLADGKNGPITLFRLCMRSINNNLNKMDICATPAIHESSSNANQMTALPLKTLCHRRIVALLADSTYNNAKGERESNIDLIYYSEESNDSWLASQEIVLQIKNNKNGPKSLSSLCLEYFQRSQDIIKDNKNEIKSLFSLCVEYIQRIQMSEISNNSILTPKSLKRIAYENIKLLLYPNDLLETQHSTEHDDGTAIDGVMINCVNTLSEEAFLNLEQFNTDIPDSSEYLDDFDNEDNFEPDVGTEGDHTEPSWASRVQMQELRSCVNTNSLYVNEQQEMEPIITQIKLEPLDDITDNLLDPVRVKTEPLAGPEHGPDEMTIIPDIKPEIEEHIHPARIHRHNSSSYDVEVFEQFVSRNKLMRALTEDYEEIYSQSSARVRRQHEPDNYEENVTDMLGLLVPHTYEPMNIQTAKGRLMDSSSDETNKNTKNASKKVAVRGRGRGRGRRTEQRANNRNIPATATAPMVAKEKEKPNNNEVAILTRKMKERIRQEEKNNVSTDSEGENVTVRLRSREKKDTSDQTRDKSKPAPSSKSKNNEIQCNNVDSTDQLEDIDISFTGFTPIETNEMSNYEKYMKYVYNNVIPGNEVEIAKDKNKLKENEAAKVKDDVVVKEKNNPRELNIDDKLVISPDEPVELLECEPSMPIFDEEIREKPRPRKYKTKAAVATDAPPYIERHGWQCYPVDSGDAKLYQNPCIFLEKLPETFVQTYFKYQNITRDQSDEEINRLTNLNSLNRSTILKDRQPKNTLKRDAKDNKAQRVSEDDSRTVSAVESDYCNELMPSDDDAPNVDDEVPQPVLRQTDNTLAKDLLMQDKESDEEGVVKIKKEPIEENSNTKKGKTISKKKASVKVEDPGNLMLTADKMMNKELTLLHAPVVMNEQVKDTLTKGPVTRHSKKSASKISLTNNKTKGEEDSSSEEEKQWVSTKEKLLKRMGKKESTSADDAKRAKLVSEFIERRKSNINALSRRGGRPRRSGKRFLEREKQLRVLQRELFGETSNDPTVSKRSVAAWKGRRNIRKVLDKKSLARSTVIANMEEFERKRRLNSRQTRLRELLGCEEGVNVLVINDEVCLEYDFEEHRPVVTIHPFFTKVMKAHQYEGVKFMWDACFESLADMEGGHAGGGCILAHCMGLGKTLQVLALLHTVLTHPRVGMHRVLVCCPLSTVLNWVDEIHKWIGPVTNQIKVFELSKLKKTYERAYQLEDWYNGGGIFIIGYELFRSLSTLDPLLDDVRPTIVKKIRSALLDPGPDIIVCDEGHLLKNDCSVLAVAMSRVVTKRRIVLTGTPMQNNLREYYCMVNFVKPNLLGTYAEYSNRFENPIMNGQHRDSREEDIKLMKARTHILHKVLEGCLQRQEASVLYPYLPKKHEYTVFIALTKCQWDLYKHYLNYYSRQQKQNSILKDFHILQKIWSHPQVLHNFHTKANETKNKMKLEKLEDDLATEDLQDLKDSVATETWWLQYLDEGNMLDTLETSNKFVVVFRILDECVALGDKVLIFSTSLVCLNALEYFLKKINKWSLGQEYYRLDGSVPPEVRQKWCREFNADNNVNTKLFLVSTRAGCLGLNMTAANRVIIMDTSWNPAHDIQSIFRVYRFGQKKDCFIYRLVAMGTMEQKIYERSVTKQAVACRVVDEQQIDRHYNMAELTELYRYDEAGASVAGGVAVGVSDVALLRVARETALHAVHEHDSLLRSSEQGLPEHERAAAWMQFQQEQAHKQMENKLIANIPKIALRRVHGQNYTTSFELSDIKPEIVTEIPSEETLPAAETKTKRGKKITKYVVQVNPQTSFAEAPQPALKPAVAKTIDLQVDPAKPGTSKNPRKQMITENLNDDLVRKISTLLIKHNFQTKKGSSEIADLVFKVRKIVKQGYILSTDADDELTASIAKVLLPQQITLPGLTEVMCESINKSATPTTSHELENILSTSTDQKETQGNNPESKRKRKAALAAEKHIDSITQDIIINLDDDLDPSDSDFVPHMVDKPDKPQTYKRKSSSRLKTSKGEQQSKPSQDSTNKIEVESLSSLIKVKPPAVKPKPGPKTFKEKLQRKFHDMTSNKVNKDSGSVERSNSILLSDDDEVSTQKETSSSVPTETTTSADPPDDEVVPLPLTLLTNKNFINIVAHTYLNGNPMLDADAATLAAQYSTLKSLTEAEQTGKDIVSGPIYDIARKVIGIDLFKRMLSTNNKVSSTSVEAANVTIELKEKMQDMTKARLEHDKKLTKKKKPIQNLNNLSHESIPTCDTVVDNPNGNVVPVGLIQTRQSMQSDIMYALSECILPDDDDGNDMHIVPHDLPHTRRPHCAPPTDPAHSATITPTTIHNPSPVILNHELDPKVSLHSTVAQLPKKFIKINSGKIVVPTATTQANRPATTPEQILPTNETIFCLDSDEEETITPTLAPVIRPNLMPVPVSLTSSNPPVVQATPSITTSATSAQAVPVKPLILRQVAAGSAPQFVLVPAAKSATPKLARLLPKPPAQSSQQKPIVGTSALPVESPKAIPSKKILQARCKPGDIIKISETGEIEVVQASQIDPSMIAGKVTIPIPREVAQPKPAETAKPKSSVAAKPKPSGTAKPLSSETVRLKLAGETVKPKPSSETVKPKPSSETVRPKPFGETVKPKPSSETVRPKPFGETVKPKPSSETVKPKPSSETIKPKPSSETVRPKPFGETVKPKPSSETVKPKPSSETVKPKPSSETVRPKPSSETAKPKPSSETVKPKPSTIAKPKLSNETVKPTSSSIYTGKPKPMASSSATPSAKTLLESRLEIIRRVSISSSSSDSRPASPVDDNPLSILKNVVRIQAFDETPASPTDKNTVNNQKSSVKLVQHTYPTKSVAQASTKISTKQSKESASKTKKDPPKVTKDKVTALGDKTSKLLCELKNKKSLTLMSNVSDKKRGASTSSVKTIVVDNKSMSSKSFTTVDLTKFSNVKSGTAATMLQTKIEAKKRVSTTETNAPKKKKTELMTLKDFNIDDIDDIIELD